MFNTNNDNKIDAGVKQREHDRTFLATAEKLNLDRVQ